MGKCHPTVCVATQQEDSSHFLTLTWWVCLQLFFELFICQLWSRLKSSVLNYLQSSFCSVHVMPQKWIFRYCKWDKMGLFSYFHVGCKPKSNTVISVLFFEIKLTWTIILLLFGLLCICLNVSLKLFSKTSSSLYLVLNLQWPWLSYWVPTVYWHIHGEW